MSILRYYSREEVADILGITTRSVSNYVKNGELVGYKVGMYWKFKAEDIDAFVTRYSSLDDLEERKEDEDYLECESTNQLWKDKRYE